MQKWLLRAVVWAAPDVDHHREEIVRHIANLREARRRTVSVSYENRTTRTEAPLPHRRIVSRVTQPQLLGELDAVRKLLVSPLRVAERERPNLSMECTGSKSAPALRNI